eukprot:gb/GEZN01006936.1/.p2 GENE.gb/GEZN01006936.1/~~gb/GEZN01006936.1/.p2  ORF type:complete len:225 (-),score=16.20 gb/GEZN01006936.1/:886-1560(-)
MMSTTCVPATASKLMKWAVASRLLVWSLALLSFHCVPSYDNSTHILARSFLQGKSSTWTDAAVHGMLGMHANWDGIHMLQIARDGYVTEQQFAFFPLLPLLLRGLAFFLTNVTGFSPWASLLLAGAFISQVSFFLGPLCTLPSDVFTLSERQGCIPQRHIFLFFPCIDLLQCHLHGKFVRVSFPVGASWSVSAWPPTQMAFDDLFYPGRRGSFQWSVAVWFLTR